MATTNRIWAGQGPIYLGVWDEINHEVISQYKIGCANRTLETVLTKEEEIIKESCSGAALDLLDYATAKSMTVNLTMQQFSQKELAMALYGSVTTKASASAETTTINQTIADGDYFHVRPGASAISIEDSDVTPTALILGTHYEVVDAEYGTIRFINVAGLVQPFVVTSDHTEYDYIQPLTLNNIVRALVFNGVSKADSTKAQIIIPKLSFPPSTVQWLSDNATTLELNGARALAADVPVGGELGQYGIVRYL